MARLVSRLHGEIGRNSFPAKGAFPHEVRLSRVIVEDEDGFRPAAGAVADAIFRLAHEEAYHAAQYNGGESARGPWLPLTEALAKERREWLTGYLAHLSGVDAGGEVAAGR